MDQEKPNPNLPYSEPPPPYSTVPTGINPNYVPPPINPNYGAPLQVPPGYAQPTTQTVVMGPPTSGQMTSVTVVNVAQWGPYPMQINCPHCGVQVLTQTNASPGLLTWLLAGALVFFGCWLGCCLIPCCIPECQDIEHRCPNCKHHLGSFRRL